MQTRSAVLTEKQPEHSSQMHALLGDALFNKVSRLHLRLAPVWHCLQHAVELGIPA